MGVFLLAFVGAILGAFAAAYALRPRMVAKPLPTPLGDLITLTVPNDALYSRACELVKKTEDTIPSTHPEAKHNEVYAQLGKDFYPQRSKSDIMLAIEAAVAAQG